MRRCPQVPGSEGPKSLRDGPARTYRQSMRTKALLTVAAMALGALLPAATVTATSNAAVQPALSPMATAPAAATAVAATTTSRMVDVLARNEAGQMILYRGNGKGGWITPYLQVGSGWGAFLKILGPGDFSGDGRADVLATNADGKMFLYRGNGKGAGSRPAQIGSGWGPSTTSSDRATSPATASRRARDDRTARCCSTAATARAAGRPYVDLGGGWGSFTAVLARATSMVTAGPTSWRGTRTAAVALPRQRRQRLQLATRPGRQRLGRVHGSGHPGGLLGRRQGRRPGTGRGWQAVALPRHRHRRLVLGPGGRRQWLERLGPDLRTRRLQR